MKTTPAKAIASISLLAAIGCLRQTDDPNQVARYYFGDIPAGVQLVQGHYERRRHPDAHSFGYLDMRMGAEAWEAIIRDGGMSLANPKRLAQANWPKGLQPLNLVNAKIHANALVVLIREENSNRVVAVSVSQFPYWYTTP